MTLLRYLNTGFKELARKLVDLLETYAALCLENGYVPEPSIVDLAKTIVNTKYSKWKSN